jgi:TonB family protein
VKILFLPRNISFLKNESGIRIAALLLSVLIHIALFISKAPADGSFGVAGVKASSQRVQSSAILERSEKLTAITFCQKLPPCKGKTSQSQGEDPRRQLQNYLELVFENIETMKFTPPETRSAKLIGNVKLAFEITDDGSFENIQIIRGSGTKKLDETALRAVYSANGKSERPEILGKDKIAVEYVLKYQFSL